MGTPSIIAVVIIPSGRYVFDPPCRFILHEPNCAQIFSVPLMLNLQQVGQHRFKLDQFGSPLSISLDGRKIVVGMPGIDGNGGDFGHVPCMYCFNLTHSSYAQHQSDIDSKIASAFVGLSFFVGIPGKGRN